MSKIVLFMDLDYFFAQVEEVENPSYRIRPLVVCVYSGRTEDSGVVSSANYLARKYGVKAGMPIKRAKHLLPSDAVYLPVRLEHYAAVSRQVMAMLEKYTDRVRVESIDEAVMDITEVVGKDFKKAEELAIELKKELRDKMGLKCSIGIAPNRVVAKIAADSAKPDGLKTVRPEEVLDFLKPLPVSALPGIGVKAEALLEDMGVKTIGDLAAQPIEVLEKLFGPKKARYIYLASRGEFDEPIQEKGTVKQVSKIITLKRNTKDLEEIVSALAPVVNVVLARLETYSLEATKVGIVAITADLRTVTRQTQIRPGAHFEETMKAVKQLFEELLQEDGGMVLRRAGVRFSGLKKRLGQSKLSSYLE
ncbi:MAG: DNA polymerase IV [Candidatus Caldarchaeum sp.]